ncbi:MAG: ABC transporter ATP-binding protein [Phycisphaeraceae bacterium]
MNQFWHFAKQMLRYKRLLAIALAGAILDSICGFGGFGALMFFIQQLFSQNTSVHDILLHKLQNPSVMKWLGDLTWLADYIPRDLLWGGAVMMGIILIFTIVGSVGRFAHEYFTMTVSLRTVMHIRKQAFQRLVHIPMTAAMMDSTADNMTRVVGNTASLARGFNAMTSKTVRNIFQTVAFLALAFFFDWFLTSLFLVGTPIIAVLIRKFGKAIRRATKRAMGEFGRMNAALQESLLALRVVKVYQTEGYERRRFNRINRDVFAQEMNARTARSLSSPVIETLAVMGVMLVMLVALWYLSHNNDEAGRVALLQVLLPLGMAANALKPLANLNNDLQESAAAAERVAEVLKLPVEPAVHHLEHVHGRPRLPRHQRLVEFRHVTFAYPARPEPVLHDISLTVPFGTTCALVGSNGSGKSTLVGLLPRLWEPANGSVIIDGTDIGTCTLPSVRRQMAMVTQDTVLFEGTVADNLRYGGKYVTRDRMIEAAQRALIHDFIMSLPQQYDTLIGEGGGRLSGGQRQRMAIARAILRDPAILILDEATSQIDSESEALITRALTRFMAGRTTFVIAHRLSTVVHADMIVVMNAGRIADVGRHDELLRRCDIYQTLCRTQFHNAGGAAAGAV